MPQPYNYSINPGYINPAQAVMQGMQVGGGLLDLREQALQRDQAAAMRPIQQQQAELGLRVGLSAEQQMLAQQQMQAAAAQSAAVRAAEMEKALQDLRQNPSIEATHSFFMAYPEHPLTKQYDKVIAARTDVQKEQDFRSMVQINAALDSGDIDAAERFMRTEAEKFGKAGDTEQQKTMLNAAEMLRNNPQAAHGAAQAMLVRLAPTIGKDITSLRTSEADVDKATAEARIANVNAENRLREIEAETGLKRAQVAKVYADIKNEAKRLDLDERKFAAESLARVKELDLKNQEVPANLVPTVIKMSDESVADDMQADQWEGVAAEFGKLESGLGVFGNSVATGARARVSESAKEFFGVDDGISVLRRRYKALMASGVVKNLPQGAASDKDIEMAKGGFPSDVSDPKKIAEFSAAMARVQRASARVKAARAEYLSRNKSPGDARGTFQVGGITVQPGMSETEVLRRVFAAQSFTE
jgi:hypothetical protein